MSLEIEDGRGSGKTAGVTSENGLLTHATTLSHLAVASNKQNGKAFYLTTDFIPLTTTGSFSGILYLKNTADLPMYIWKIRTCGTMSQQWKLLKNPTAGTLISAGTDRAAENLNTQSTSALDAILKAGADAQTVTDGTHWSQWINNGGHSTAELDGAMIIGPGAAFALVCKPGAAGDVCANILATQEMVSL